MSGGTYSVYRFFYGAWLGSVLVRSLMGCEDPVRVAAAALGALGCLALAAGLRDHFAAAVVAPAVVLAWPAQGLAFTALAIAPLLVHVSLASAPYGSLDAYGRPDPAGDFAFSATLTFVVSAALVGVYGALALGLFGAGPETASGAFAWGFTGAVVIFATLSCVPRARGFGWAVMAAALLARFWLVDDDLGVPLLFVHGLVFDPALIPPRASRRGERVFYDGNCGLCHRSVRFALAEDRSGEAFRFAPLHGEAFRAELDEAAARGLPDSIVVVTDDGRVLVRSRAIFRMMDGLGGLWRGVATVLRLIPRPVADGAYDGVAAVRHRVFPRPADVCPVIPKRLRSRFEP